MKVPFSEANRLAGLIEPAIELAMSINDKAKTLKKQWNMTAQSLKALYDKDEQIMIDPIEGKTVGMKKLIDLAIGIEGLKTTQVLTPQG